jgi:hypothetical protein
MSLAHTASRNQLANIASGGRTVATTPPAAPSSRPNVLVNVLLVGLDRHKLGSEYSRIHGTVLWVVTIPRCDNLDDHDCSSCGDYEGTANWHH